MSGVIQVCITCDIPEHKVLTQASYDKLSHSLPFSFRMICASLTFIHWVAMCTQEYLLNWNDIN